MSVELGIWNLLSLPCSLRPGPTKCPLKERCTFPEAMYFCVPELHENCFVLKVFSYKYIEKSVHGAFLCSVWWTSQNLFRKFGDHASLLNGTFCIWPCGLIYFERLGKYHHHHHIFLHVAVSLSEHQRPFRKWVSWLFMAIFSFIK